MGNINYFVEVGRYNARGKNDLWTDELTHFMDMVNEGQAFQAIIDAYHFGYGKAYVKENRKKNRRHTSKANRSEKSEGYKKG